MARQNNQPFHEAIMKPLRRFCSRKNLDLADVAADIQVSSTKLYNMSEDRQKWTPEILRRLYRYMLSMGDRAMAKKFLQALFDDDEITIPNAGDVIRDKMCSLMYRTMKALDDDDLDSATARAIATEAERFGATVKKKAQEKSG